MSKVVPQLRMTTKYDMFNEHPHNRDISSTKLLEKSMKRYGYDPGFPIRCIYNLDGQLQVTHGHHRLYVAEKLGLPVWYIICDRNIELFSSEGANRQWNSMDYATARTRGGDDVAAEVLEYHKTTGIPLTACVGMFTGNYSGSGNAMQQFKDGTMKITTREHARLVAHVVNACKEAGVSWASRNGFVCALSLCIACSQFDVSRFVSKVQSHAHMMHVCRTQDEYLQMIESVYNRQTADKVPIMFLAQQGASSRNFNSR